MTHADFRGTPTYFAVFKMMISSKNVNQNMLKIVFKMMISSKNVNQNMLKIPYFSKKICKNSPSSGGSASRSHLASGGWGLCSPIPLPVQSYPYL